MTLLEILLHELEQWPEGKEYAFQSSVNPEVYFSSSIEGVVPKEMKFSQIASNRGSDHKVTREEWETAKIKSLPFFPQVAAILGEEEAVKELLAVGEISRTAKELDEAFLFIDTPQGFEFWTEIAETNRDKGKKLKEALELITAAMIPGHFIRLHPDGSGSVRDSDYNEIIYFSNTEDLVNKYLSLSPLKFDHWDLLHDRFNWIAKDCEGNWWAYDDKPVQSDKGWKPNGAFRSLGALKIDIPCHWRKSLIKRPAL